MSVLFKIIRTTLELIVHFCFQNMENPSLADLHLNDGESLRWSPPVMEGTINDQDVNGETKLHKAVDRAIFIFYNEIPYNTCQDFSEYLVDIKYLLKLGASMDICDQEGTSPLEMALFSGILDLVEVFLPIEKTNNNTMPDNHKRSKHIVDYLLNRQKILGLCTPHCLALLYFTIICKDNETFKFLLQTKQSDILKFRSCYSLMHVVATYGTCELVQSLIDYGVNVNIKIVDEVEQSTPLHQAAFARNFEIVEMLVNKGADINAHSYYGTPLHFACGNFNGVRYRNKFIPTDTSNLDYVNRDIIGAKIAKFLIERGADVDDKNCCLSTPLQIAASNKYHRVVELLLQHGADFSLKNRYGLSILHSAVCGNRIEIIKIFLEKGLDPNDRSLYGLTPLVSWIMNLKECSSSILELLIKFGADIDAIDNFGETPLHVSCKSYAYKHIKYLLKFNASVMIRNKSGKIPLEYLLRQYEEWLSGVLENCECLENVCALMFLAVIKCASNKDLELIKTKELGGTAYKIFECEINRMKADKICKFSALSYFDLLNGGYKKLAVYTKNKEIMKVLDVGDYKYTYPIYAQVLEEFLEEAKIWRDFTERNVVILEDLMEHNLSHLITDTIFKHLTTGDMKNLNEAFQNCCT